LNHPDIKTPSPTIIVGMKKSLCLAVVLSLWVAAAAAENWPQWRGPNLNGTSGERNLPLKWSAEENVAWRLAMPAWSGSTPIVWGDYIFLNVAEGDDLYLWTVNRNDGTVRWKKRLGGGNVKMRKQNMSSPSPVTDGKNVWALTGTGILKGFDLQGNELWARDIQKDYGRFGLNWGYGSSPLLYEDALYVQVLHGMRTDDPSYLLRIDPKSGKTLWRVERPTPAIQESPDAYTTPQVLRRGAAAVNIVLTGGDVITGHDPATGRELWRRGGMNPQNNPAGRVIASAVVFDEMLWVPTRVRPLQAFRTAGGSEPELAYTFNNGPDVPTPVSDGKYFWSVTDNGVMYCLDARTGAEVWARERLKTGTYSSSIVLADGKLYISNEDGVTSVVAAGPKFEILAENTLEGYTLSSPAVSEGQLFLRNDKYVFAVGQRVTPPAPRPAAKPSKPAAKSGGR
jgi:outer membrane protein assembly factor BamB